MKTAYDAFHKNVTRAGTSPNRAAKALPASALGLVHRKRPDHVAAFAALAGTITAEDAAALRRAVAAQRTIIRTAAEGLQIKGFAELGETASILIFSG